MLLKEFTLLVSFFWLILIRIVSTDKWPTFTKPTNSFQDCYLCPPGYYMENECPVSRDDEPGYSECIKCDDGTYTDTWNRSPRCWDHDRCSNNEEKICEHGLIGKAECGCVGETHRENGVCVKSISFSKHEWALEDRDIVHAKEVARIKTLSCPPCPTRSTTQSTTITCKPCPEILQVTPTTSSIVMCPLCKVTECGNVVAFFIGGMALGIFLIGIPFGFREWQYKKKRKARRRMKQNGRTQSNNETIERGHQNEHSREDEEHGGVQSLPGPNAIPVAEMEIPTEERVPLEVQLDQGDLRNEPNTVTQDAEVEAQAVPIPDPDLQWDTIRKIFEIEITNEADLYKFLRHILELKGKEADRICDLKLYLGQKIGEGIDQYRNLADTTIQTLVKNLRRQNSNETARKIVERLGIEDVPREPESTNRLEKAFRVVEKLITSAEAFNFFRNNLELDEHQIDQTNQGSEAQRVFKGLRIWQNRNGNLATVEKLIEILKNDFNGIAHAIEDEVLHQAATNTNVINGHPGSLIIDNEANPGNAREGLVRETAQPTDGTPSESTTTHSNQNGQSASQGPEVPESATAQLNQMGQTNRVENPGSNSGGDCGAVGFSSVNNDQRQQGQFNADSLTETPTGDEKYTDEGVVTEIDHVNEIPLYGMKATPTDEGSGKETTLKEYGTNDENTTTSQTNPKAISSTNDGRRDDKSEMKKSDSKNENLQSDESLSSYSESRNADETILKGFWHEVRKIFEIEISNKDDLYNFLRHILELEGNEVERICDLELNLGQKIGKGLFQYRNLAERTIQTLVKNLRRQNSNETARKIVEKLGIEDVPREPATTNLLEKDTTTSQTNPKAISSTNDGRRDDKSEMKKSDSKNENLQSDESLSSYSESRNADETIPKGFWHEDEIKPRSKITSPVDDQFEEEDESETASLTSKKHDEQETRVKELKINSDKDNAFVDHPDDDMNDEKTMLINKKEP